MEPITETKIGNATAEYIKKYCVEYINKYCRERVNSYSCGSCMFRGDDWEFCEAHDPQSKTYDEVVNLARRIAEAGDHKDAIPDQTAKADAGKPDLTLVPQEIIWDIARTREYGTKKYGDPDNWKRVEIERYRAAAFRHLLKYLGDPHGYDEESGLPHLYHLATNVAFLCEMETYWEGVVGDGIPGHIEPKHECNHCEYYGGVHEVMGHAPCEHPEVGTSAVLWNETCKYWKLHEGYKS